MPSGRQIGRHVAHAMWLTSNSGSDGDGQWRWFSNFLTSMPLHLILQGWFRSSVGVEYRGKARKRWSYSVHVSAQTAFSPLHSPISVSSVAVKFSSAGYTTVGQSLLGVASSVVVCCCVANLRDSLILFILVSPPLPLPPSATLLLVAFGVALVEACDKCGRSWFWGSRYLFASEEILEIRSIYWWSTVCWFVILEIYNSTSNGNCGELWSSLKAAE